MSVQAEVSASWRAYRHLIGASVRAQMQFRTSLFMQMVASCALTATNFIEVLVIFDHLPMLGNWSAVEVAFLYGASGIGFGLCDMAIGSIERTGELVRTGKFDSIMLRPVGTLVSIAGSDMALRRVGGIAQAALVFVVASARVGIEFNVRNVVLIVVMIFGGTAIFAAVFLATAAIQFWMVGANEIGNALTYGGNYLTSFPLPVFSGWLRRLLAYVVPLAFCAYLPALAILNKPDELGIPAFLRYASPAVAAIVFLAAYGFWRLGVRHYRSTGS